MFDSDNLTSYGDYIALSLYLEEVYQMKLYSFELKNISIPFERISIRSKGISIICRVLIT